MGNGGEKRTEFVIEQKPRKRRGLGYLAVFLVLVFVLPMAAGASKAKLEPPDELEAFSSYNQLIGLLGPEPNYKYRTGCGVKTDDMDMDGGMPGGLMVENSTAGPPGADSGDSERGHSETNVSVSGVDEGDIVKTDGNWLYVINALSLSVVDPDNMTVRAKIDYENFRPTELYLPKSQEGKLVVTGTCFDEPLYKRFKRSRYYPAARIAVNDCAYYPYYVHNSVMVKIYDIAGLLEAGSAGASDEGAYTPERELKFKNATLNTSRIANGTLYLIVNYGAMYSDNFVYPALQDSENGTYDIPASSILMMSAPKYYYYNLMFAIAIDLDGGQTGVQGFVGYGWINYCTEQSLYFAMSRYEYETETINGQTYYSHYRYTDIVRFSIDEAKIEYAGKFIADGYLKDQFGMSEYAGFLRVATTVDNRGTGSGWQNVTDCIITTLRISDLSEAGRIGGLGKPGERIYASRFYGDRAVVVTYRQTDPLSVVDLSDPREPEILVQFIIDGVSDYLQFFTEDLVFSIGRGEESPGRLGDVKTELYYIDDDFIATAETPSLACYMLNSGGNSWTSASYDYKAILHYQNLYAFPVTSYSYTWDSQYYTYKSESLLYLYTITGEGADAKMAQAALAYKGDDFFCGNKGGDYYFGIYVDNLRRAVIIGEHIYLVGTNKIQRYVYANVLAGTLGTPATVKIV